MPLLSVNAESFPYTITIRTPDGREAGIEFSTRSEGLAANAVAKVSVRDLTVAYAARDEPLRQHQAQQVRRECLRMPAHPVALVGAAGLTRIPGREDIDRGARDRQAAGEAVGADGSPVSEREDGIGGDQEHPHRVSPPAAPPGSRRTCPRARSRAGS